MLDAAATVLEQGDNKFRRVLLWVAGPLLPVLKFFKCLRILQESLDFVGGCLWIKKLSLGRHWISLFVKSTVTLVVLQRQFFQLIRRLVINLLIAHRDDLDDGTSLDR
jgi:hypothetical protein